MNVMAMRSNKFHIGNMTADISAVVVKIIKVKI